jgi:cytoskeletal protein CcmA (bactofilin family)
MTVTGSEHPGQGQYGAGHAAKRQAKAAYRQAKADYRVQKEAFKAQVRQGRDHSGFGELHDEEGKRLVEGIINMEGGSFGQVFVEGILNCRSDLKAQLLDVEGVVNLKGGVQADEFVAEGTANIGGDLTVGSANISGVVDVHGKMEGNDIYCEGALRVEGELSADQIDAEGVVRAAQIVGDRVRIHSHTKNWWTGLFGLNDKIELIEATSVELEKVYAKQVNGQDIIIGPKCQIDHLDCSGTLHVDASAVVTEISGDYKLV